MWVKLQVFPYSIRKAKIRVVPLSESAQAPAVATASDFLLYVVHDRLPS